MCSTCQNCFLWEQIFQKIEASSFVVTCSISSSKRMFPCTMATLDRTLLAWYDVTKAMMLMLKSLLLFSLVLDHRVVLVVALLIRRPAFPAGVWNNLATAFPISGISWHQSGYQVNVRRCYSPVDRWEYLHSIHYDNHHHVQWCPDHSPMMMCC